MRGRLRLRQFALLALVVFSIVGLTAGCTSTPHREIEAIGVVASEDGSTHAADIVETFTFDDGRTYTIRYEVDKGIQGTGAWPQAGDLLIAGSRPNNWMLVATPRKQSEGTDFPAGCFGLGSQAGWDRETTIDLDFGVTLQKAPDFVSSGHVPLAHFGILGVICLDGQGG